MAEEVKKESRWRGLRDNAVFRNVLGYLVFVVIAAAFWFILRLNDSMMESFEVKVNVVNVPDTVTFINDPPAVMHVVVRDKATSLMRNGGMNTPEVNINFEDFSGNNTFRFTRNDILAALKTTFGNNAQLMSVSLDSIHCVYTTLRGRRVPVESSCEFYASSGNVIMPRLNMSPSHVMVYSASQEQLDTLTRVFTQHIVKRNLSENARYDVALVGIRGTKFIPSNVRIGVTVEPLVSKEAVVPVTVLNVPENESVVLFPSKVAVGFYVPMSRFNQTNPGIIVTADYADIRRLHSHKLPLNITHIPNDISSVKLFTDSVEYTLVK